MKAGGAIGTLAVVAMLAYAVITGAISPAQLLGDVLGEAGIEMPASLIGGSSGPEPSASAAGSGPATSQYAPAAMSAADAQYALDTIVVAAPGSMSGYSREEFEHWSNASEFGWEAPDASCDVRDAALIRDGRDVSVGAGCKIGSGSWLDPYTGTTYTSPSDIDIDHVVALANAWRSGASAWSDADREAYANSPSVLLSVEDNANQTKGDKGPEAWQPENTAYHCEFARRWIGIKSDWGLTVNADEKAALQGMLASCSA